MPANDRHTQSARRSGPQAAPHAPQSHAQAAAYYSGSVPPMRQDGRPYSTATPPMHSGWQQIPPSSQPPQPPMPRKPRQPRRPYHPKPWVKYAALAFVIAIIAVIVTSCVSANQAQQHDQALKQEVKAYDGFFCQGVYVDGIHLGGMTAQQGMDAVLANAEQRLSSWEVRLTFQGETVAVLNAQTLGVNVEVSDALTRAWMQGHEGTYEERKQAMDALLETPFYAFTTENAPDFTVVDQMLTSLEQALYIAPQDAVLLTFDAGRTYPFIFQDEVLGRQLNMDSLRSDVTAMIQTGTSGAIELQVTTAQPAVTVDYLKKNIVCERATAYTDISTSSDDDRNNNIRLAFSRINGTIVMPGETFSFNKVVGDRTRANGFFPAMEYVYREEQMGIGGGVCQASTTVYQAAVYAGMKITDRSPHSLVVNYSPFGKDATVNSTKGHHVDLKFVNNTDYPIYIKAGVESKSTNKSRLVTRVTIYGCSKGEGVTYDFAVTEEPIPAPEEAQIVVDKTGEYVTYENEEYEYQKAKEGTKVTSYHVKYVNGVEQERYLLDVDTYNPKQRILYVGATPAE